MVGVIKTLPVINSCFFGRASAGRTPISGSRDVDVETKDSYDDGYPVAAFTSRICDVCLAEWAANSKRNW
jgi:hypothetical protein